MNVPTDALPIVRRRTAEAAAWCAGRASAADPRGSVRSPELAPPEPLFAERTNEDGTLAYEVPSGERRLALVRAVIERRASLLGHASADVAPAVTSGGRLLAFEVDYSIWDGLSGSESNGFLDGFDTPGWDTWVHLTMGERTDVLYCWVPEPFVPLAEGAIQVNATGCLAWVTQEGLGVG